MTEFSHSFFSAAMTAARSLAPLHFAEKLGFRIGASRRGPHRARLWRDGVV